MKKILCICYAVLLILGSCSKSKSNREVQQSLSFGIMPSMDYIPFLVAQKEGIYDSLGLEVNFVNFNSLSERNAAIQSGSIDGTIIDYTGVAILQSQNTPVKIIMKTDGCFSLITRKESGIKSLKQLKGHNIGVSHYSAIDYATDYALNKASILRSEVNKPEINRTSLRLKMLEYQQIDASFFPDPFASIAMNKGYTSIITTQDLGISLTGTAFSEKALKEKNREIKLFVQGYNMAVDYIKNYPLKKWEQILVENIGVSQALASIIVLPQYRKAMLPEAKDLEGTIAWLKAKNLISPTYNIQQMTDSICLKNPETETN
ncbi:MetQ/NlpA family ABC transporter substrate-binding protein [uncultured Bacteroides sp.]|uniref:ABC transporter substrate-binding protein n=1 Tax=uncultured Bacteroides sp. TaxID=162156 RepID=UPI002AABCABA|nr:MetQ/NlpA family ABC transporter substrate-binding protein [uncultured Bacteroides sp.]